MSVAFDLQLAPHLDGCEETRRVLDEVGENELEAAAVEFRQHVQSLRTEPAGEETHGSPPAR